MKAVDSLIRAGACLSLVAYAAWGCSNDCHDGDVQISALSGPDSVEVGSGFWVNFTFMPGHAENIDSYSWRKLDESTFELLVQYRYCDSYGPPAG